MSASKETIGVKIPLEWKSEIEKICKGLGMTRSEWLIQVIGNELGKTGVNAVNDLLARVERIEKKLSRLTRVNSD